MRNATLGIGFAEIEAGRDLDEALRIGEAFELDAGELSHRAAPAVAADHVIARTAARRRPATSTSTSMPSAVSRQPGHGMRKAHIEVGGVAVFRRDRRRQLVLLVLQHVRKPELVLHQAEIEFGHHGLRHPVVETIGAGNEAERDDLLGHAEIVEHLQGRRMQRGGALILDGRGLLLEHGDGNAAAVERQRADHADRPCPDDDDARARLRCRHAGIASPVYFIQAAAMSSFTAIQLALSAAMILAISCRRAAGRLDADLEQPIGKLRRFSRRRRPPCEIWSTISCGVPAGAENAVVGRDERASGRVSEMVGTSGRCARALLAADAERLHLVRCRCSGFNSTGLAEIIWTLPASISVNAGPRRDTARGSCRGPRSSGTTARRHAWCCRRRPRRRCRRRASSSPRR